MVSSLNFDALKKIAWKINICDFSVKALYSRVGNFRKSTVPQVGGHLCKLIWFWIRNIAELINLFIVISEAVKTS